MKVYLDDIRPTPDGWVRCFWPDEVIALLKTGEVREVSLDHDLGDDERGDGYDVLLWIEEEQHRDMFFQVPDMKVHSANSGARPRMEAAIRTIQGRCNKPIIPGCAYHIPPTLTVTMTGYDPEKKLSAMKALRRIGWSMPKVLHAINHPPVVVFEDYEPDYGYYYYIPGLDIDIKSAIALLTEAGCTLTQD